MDKRLTVAQPETQKLTDAEWLEFQVIPDEGYSHCAWIVARIAERVTVACRWYGIRLPIRRHLGIGVCEAL